MYITKTSFSSVILGTSIIIEYFLEGQSGASGRCLQQVLVLEQIRSSFWLHVNFFPILLNLSGVVEGHTYCIASNQRLDSILSLF